MTKATDYFWGFTAAVITFLMAACGASPKDGAEVPIDAAAMEDSMPAPLPDGMAPIVDMMAPVPDVDPVPAMSLRVEGAAAGKCLVIGPYGIELGSGFTEAVEYRIPAGVTTPELAIVRCDDRASVFDVGAASVTLTARSKRIADLVQGRSLRSGTKLIVHAMDHLMISGEAQAATVLDSLAQFLKAQDDVLDPAPDSLSSNVLWTAAATAKVPKVNDIIKMLVTMGQPVVVQNVGSGKTLGSCSNADAQSAFGDGLSAVDAAIVGMTGCLVYHNLYAITDLNNPLFTPDNVPASFRAVISENGGVAELRDAIAADRAYNVNHVHKLMFTLLGHKGFSEDDEGQISSQVVAQDALSSWVTVAGNVARGTFGGSNSCGGGKTYVCHKESNTTHCLSGSPYDSHIAHGDAVGPCNGGSFLELLKGFRFHTGYNPSGGWEMDVAAAKTETVPIECVDSSKSTACSLPALRFNVSGTTATQSASGSYGLQLEFRGGGFASFAWVIDLTTSKYLRDSLYQRVKVTINPADYTAINYANPFYDRCLDAMTVGAVYGTGCYGGVSSSVASAPYANMAWRTLYPGMTNIDNAYLYPSPEVVARQGALLASVDDWSSMTAVEAFGLFKLLTQGTVAIPLPSGIYVLLEDHGKTLRDWDASVAAWLKGP